MHELKFAKQFTLRRKQLGLTQGDVAAYVGVSNAAVSKWEQALSYPDLTLLPKLATLLNMRIDELLGYEPQLTRKRIFELYALYAKRLSSEPFEAVQTDIEEMVKEYYACYPFLVRIAQLYLNYYSSSPNPEATLNRVIELCERIIAHSGDYQLAEEANMFYASVLLLLGKPNELLQHLGEDIKIIYGTEQMIAQAHAMLGKPEKSKLILQASAYQHLIYLVSNSIESLSLEAGNVKQFDKLIERIQGLIDIFQLNKLNINQVLIFYYRTAVILMQQQRPEEALRMLEQYYRACSSVKFPVQICGDDYFYLIDNWLNKDSQLGVQSPRDEHSIKSDMLKLLDEPIFAPLRETDEFKAIASNLRHVLKL